MPYGRLIWQPAQPEHSNQCFNVRISKVMPDKSPNIHVLATAALGAPMSETELGLTCIICSD